CSCRQPRTSEGRSTELSPTARLARSCSTGTAPGWIGMLPPRALGVSRVGTCVVVDMSCSVSSVGPRATLLIPPPRTGGYGSDRSREEMFSGSMRGDAAPARVGRESAVTPAQPVPSATPWTKSRLSLHTSVRCFCDRASTGPFAHEESDRKVSVAGCRIGGMLFVVGIEGGHRDRPELRRSGMTHYLLTVHGPAEMDEFGNYGSK